MEKKTQVTLERARFGWGNFQVDLYEREYYIRKIGRHEVTESGRVGCLTEISEFLEKLGLEVVNFRLIDKGKVTLLKNINVKT